MANPFEMWAFFDGGPYHHTVVCHSVADGERFVKFMARERARDPRWAEPDSRALINLEAAREEERAAAVLSAHGRTVGS